jgi:Protein of unknown function (DUF2934)
MTDSSRDRQIAERAHAKWEAEGCPDGRDKDHWLQAEAEVGPAAETGPAQMPEHAAPGEAREPGAPDAGSDLPEALAQPGEGVPDPADPAASQRSPRNRRTPQPRSDGATQ